MPKTNFNNLITRTLSGLVMFIALLFVMFFHKGILLTVIILTATVAFLEVLFVNKYPKSIWYTATTMVLFVWSITSQSIYQLTSKSFPIGISNKYDVLEWKKLFLFVAVVFLTPLFSKKINFKAAFTHIVALILLVVASRSTVWFLFKSTDHGKGFEILLLVLGTVFACDTGGYFFGSKFGKNKISPKISPKKTWEGFLGGLFLAYVWSWLWIKLMFVPFVNNDPQKTLLFIFLTGWVFAISSLIGDLYFSYIKRIYNAHDFSKAIPGHGGVLDRIDSIIFAIIIAKIIYNFIF